jgi:hypothetical protein
MIANRPSVAATEKSRPGEFSTYPVTATISSASEFHLDREVRFAFRNSLSYQIVVNWVIAEHKSQGLFQSKCGQDRFENFWAFSIKGGLCALADRRSFRKDGGTIPSDEADGRHRGFRPPVEISFYGGADNYAN